MMWEELKPGPYLYKMKIDHKAWDNVLFIYGGEYAGEHTIEVVFNDNPETESSNHVPLGNAYIAIDSHLGINAKLEFIGDRYEHPEYFL